MPLPGDPSRATRMSQPLPRNLAFPFFRREKSPSISRPFFCKWFFPPGDKPGPTPPPNPELRQKIFFFKPIPKKAAISLLPGFSYARGPPPTPQSLKKKKTFSPSAPFAHPRLHRISFPGPEDPTSFVPLIKRTAPLPRTSLSFSAALFQASGSVDAIVSAASARKRNASYRDWVVPSISGGRSRGPPLPFPTSLSQRLPPQQENRWLFREGKRPFRPRTLR